MTAPILHTAAAPPPLPHGVDTIECLGTCRTGKSYLAEVLCEIDLRRRDADQAARAIILDRSREPQYRGVLVERIADLKRHRDARRWVLRPPITADEFARFVLHWRVLYPSLRLVAIVDEATDEDISTRGAQFASPEVKKLYHQARGIRLITCSQRPAGVATGIRALTNRWNVFRVPDAADLKVLRENRLPEEWCNVIATLPAQHFVTFDRGI